MIPTRASILVTVTGAGDSGVLCMAMNKTGGTPTPTPASREIKNPSDKIYKT